MCGITGFWVRRGESAAWLADLGRSVEALGQRGPDDRGTWVRAGGALALGHTRLSILDLSPLGRQPMHSADGQLTMVFNGEVYNFAEVRSELEALGHRFRSSGDSEVVLAALREWGPEAVRKFVGMFAIALWDERARRLTLLRDRLGVKPLYYAWNGSAFWFGSELKALRAFRAWQPEIDREALGEYLQFGYVSAPRAIYRNVAKLPPGHWLELGEVGSPRLNAYWSPEQAGETLEEREPVLEEQLEALMVEAFRYRMVSDVPVGVFLSGGIDSSLVTALLQRYGGGEVRTFTIGFAEAQFDESRWAKRVAGHLGTTHTERIVSASDMASVLRRWADLFDEPFGDSSGVPTYLVSQLARESVKVALSADGGDELFSGYHHYGVVLDRERALSRVPAFARNAFSRSLEGMPAESLDGWLERLPMPRAQRHAARRIVLERLEKLRPVLPQVDRAALYDLSMSFWTPAEIARLAGQAPAREPWGTGRGHYADQLSLCDLRYYLPDDILAKVDRTTMATGLEGREPMLDHRLVEFALRLPLAMRRGALGTKHLVRRILYRHVPRELIERPKQGFAVPLSSWMRGELAPLIGEYLSPERVRAAGLFDPALVARAISNFMDGGPEHDRIDMNKLWLLLAFEMWRGKWMAEERHEEAPHARAVHH